jgi:hypothetical protein
MFRFKPVYVEYVGESYTHRVNGSLPLAIYDELDGRG